MGQIRKSQPVKLIAGFIFKDDLMLKKAIAALEKQFGKVDFRSPVLPFNHTDYYENEFGSNLKRAFVAFKSLISPDSLPKIKIISNKIERKNLSGLNRVINIDPGYVDLAKLVLASTKDFTHRINVGKDIYAEVTLFYEHKSFRPRDWTYPDYRSQEYIAIFNEIRDIYAGQLKDK